MVGKVRAVFSASPRYPSGTNSRRASQPSPSPGRSTRLKSTATTVVSAKGVNVAARTSAPRVATVVICAPDSEAPTASMMIRLGNAASSRSRTVGDSGAPPLVSAIKPDRS